MSKSTRQYLYTVERSNGQEIMDVLVEGLTPKVEAQFLDNGQVRLVRGGDVFYTGDTIFDNADEELTLVRYLDGDKAGRATRTPIERP